MSVVLLDEIVLDWLRAGLSAVNDVLTHYRGVRKSEGAKSMPVPHERAGLVGGAVAAPVQSLPEVIRKNEFSNTLMGKGVQVE